MECINCKAPFKERKDKRGYFRHPLTGKLFKGKDTTVRDAINCCLNISLTPSKKSENFLCTECFTALGNFYNSLKARDNFCSKKVSDSYISRKRGKTTPLKTPISVKKQRLLSTSKQESRSTNCSVSGRINGNLRAAINALTKRHYKAGIRALCQGTEGMRKAVKECCFDLIRQETKKIVSHNMHLCDEISIENLKSFSWSKVVSEVQIKAPTTYGALAAMTSQSKYIKSLKEIGSIVSMILFRRNKRFKIFQTFNSILLWTGGCKANVLTKFNRMGWCLGPSATRRAIDNIRKDFDRDIILAKRRIEKDLESVGNQSVVAIDSTTNMVDNGDEQNECISESNNEVNLISDISEPLKSKDSYTDVFDEEVIENDNHHEREVCYVTADTIDVNVDVRTPNDEICVEAETNQVQEDERNHTRVRRRLFDLNRNRNATIDSEAEGFHPGFSFCWDNVGRHLKVRSQTTEHQNHYYMWALAYAAENRVPTSHLSTTDSVAAVSIPLKRFLPNGDDFVDLKNRLIFEVQSVAAKYFVCFQAFKPKPATHEYSVEMSKKSHLINLGIIQENPSSTAGTIAILENLQQYVPQVDGVFNPCIVHGDGLTCERHNDAQNARAGGNNAADRLEGLEPSPQEFHKRMHLLQDTWNEFFDGKSATEKGTLYNIKNAFNHRSVGKDVSKCFNHAVDLLNHVTDSYCIVALMHMMQIENTDESPPDFPDTAAEQKKYMLQTSASLVNYLWHNTGTENIDPADIPRDEASPICVCQDDLDDTVLVCTNSFCSIQKFHISCMDLGDAEDLPEPWFCSESCKIEAGRYKFCYCKKDKGLKVEMIGCDNSECKNGTWFHMDCVNINAIPEGKWFCSVNCQESKESSNDFKLNYTKGLLWRGLNDRVRHTAERRGDGQALMRFWKLDLGHFYLNNHPKYFILAHRLLAGVNGFLSTKLRQDLIWNRTVNLTGGPDSNLAMDLVNEFENKEFINSLSSTGRLTDETIDRHGKMTGGLKKDIDSVYDQLAGDKTWNGSGGKKNRLTDVFRLVKYLQSERLMQYKKGRSFKSFPEFKIKSYGNSVGSMLVKIEKLSKKLDRRKRIL